MRNTKKGKERGKSKRTDDVGTDDPRIAFERMEEGTANQWDTLLGIIAADSLATILGVTRCCSILVQRDNEEASMPHYARTNRHRTATIRSDFSRRNYDIDKPVSAAPDHDY